MKEIKTIQQFIASATAALSIRMSAMGNTVEEEGTLISMSNVTAFIRHHIAKMAFHPVRRNGVNNDAHVQIRLSYTDIHGTEHAAYFGAVVGEASRATTTVISDLLDPNGEKTADVWHADKSLEQLVAEARALHLDLKPKFNHQILSHMIAEYYEGKKEYDEMERLEEQTKRNVEIEKILEDSKDGISVDALTNRGTKSKKGIRNLKQLDAFLTRELEDDADDIEWDVELYALVRVSHGKATTLFSVSYNEYSSGMDWTLTPINEVPPTDQRYYCGMVSRELKGIARSLGIRTPAPFTVLAELVAERVSEHIKRAGAPEIVVDFLHGVGHHKVAVFGCGICWEGKIGEIKNVDELIKFVNKVAASIKCKKGDVNPHFRVEVERTDKDVPPNVYSVEVARLESNVIGTFIKIEVDDMTKHAVYAADDIEELYDALIDHGLEFDGTHPQLVQRLVDFEVGRKALKYSKDAETKGAGVKITKNLAAYDIWVAGKVAQVPDAESELDLLSQAHTAIMSTEIAKDELGDLLIPVLFVRQGKKKCGWEAEEKYTAEMDYEGKTVGMMQICDSLDKRDEHYYCDIPLDRLRELGDAQGIDVFGLSHTQIVERMLAGSYWVWIEGHSFPVNGVRFQSDLWDKIADLAFVQEILDRENKGESIPVVSCLMNEPLGVEKGALWEKVLVEIHTEHGTLGNTLQPITDTRESDVHHYSGSPISALHNDCLAQGIDVKGMTHTECAKQLVIAHVKQRETEKAQAEVVKPVPQYVDASKLNYLRMDALRIQRINQDNYKPSKENLALRQTFVLKMLAALDLHIDEFKPGLRIFEKDTGSEFTFVGYSDAYALVADSSGMYRRMTFGNEDSYLSRIALARASNMGERADDKDRVAELESELKDMRELVASMRTVTQSDRGTVANMLDKYDKDKSTVELKFDAICQLLA